MSDCGNKETYSFSILNDSASESDLFEDKTHERVSNQLYKLILSEEKGITIGTEGAWGSGKSTVVNLLQEKFDRDNGNALFFMFDAWAHEGDPLRRIFLESLIKKATTKKFDHDLDSIAKKNIEQRKAN